MYPQIQTVQTPPPSPDSLRATALAPGQRLIVVSNRLPVTVERNDARGYSLKESSGGLATGMSGVKREFEMLWYGWPGIEVPSDEESEISHVLRQKHGAVPIFLQDSIADAYYNGFSNSALWPLLHYQPNAFQFHQSEWKAYWEVNQIFAQRLAADVSDGDLVWIHDYHLMLLPRMLSEAAMKLGKRLTIGFFLHTPFPCGDMFKVLPVWDVILEGLVHCKMLGFHTLQYAQNFARTCCDDLNFKQFPDGIERLNTFVGLGVYPIGIDVPKFLECMESESMMEQVREFRRKYDVCKLIIGVDRLDYTKGIPQKIMSFERFLDLNPRFIGQISMIQVAVPSRESVQEYKELAKALYYQVEALNKKYGSNDYKPVHLLQQSVPFEQLMTMYAASDVCFVSSIRDGMNLVSYEYVATQRDRKGVLLLSEFAGAAGQLRGSVTFNPWDIDGTAVALTRAVTMGLEERRANQKRSEDYVLRNSSAVWSKSFISDLTSLGSRLSIR
ncbi:alpha,alpha-trehalose-phosphate synthase (UDP-forming) [Exophiala spinifera]|uniref:Alpha,alpha-trehalose-phosphate synthase (UDP-forming) n=1 Tax=Exophiala spinifera TaxID=91928 RepID=A0A0D2AUF1_9EURO|nr:alpha,alpha-trehalose-phosphate synthase (UDP-forming) [Exophiala spinifera]KIW10110.1 alpha,alpha-trehalose-phosphate synthase (UDP-forming) [Exophiala spinifera]